MYCECLRYIAWMSDNSTVTISDAYRMSLCLDKAKDAELNHEPGMLVNLFQQFVPKAFEFATALLDEEEIKAKSARQIIVTLGTYPDKAARQKAFEARLAKYLKKNKEYSKAIKCRQNAEKELHDVVNKIISDFGFENRSYVHKQTNEQKIIAEELAKYKNDDPQELVNEATFMAFYPNIYARYLVDVWATARVGAEQYEQTGLGELTQAVVMNHIYEASLGICIRNATGQLNDPVDWAGKFFGTQHGSLEDVIKLCDLVIDTLQVRGELESLWKEVCKQKGLATIEKEDIDL